MACISLTREHAWLRASLFRPNYKALRTGGLRDGSDARDMIDTLETPKKPIAHIAGSPAGRDRRVCPRYPFTATAETLDANSRSRMNARTSDISIGGCYVDTFCPLPRKTDVKIRISRDGESLEAQATVVYSKIGMGMGLRFSSMEPRHRATLNRWIAELSGGAPLSFDQHHHAEEPAAEHAAKPAIAPSQPRPENNGSSLVVGELIIALMRRGALSPEEGNSLLCKLTTRSGL